MEEVIDATTTPVSEATQHADEKQKISIQEFLNKKKKRQLQKKERSEATATIRLFQDKKNQQNFSNNESAARLLNRRKNLEGKLNRLKKQLASVDNALGELSLNDTTGINEARRCVGLLCQIANAYHEPTIHKKLKCTCHKTKQSSNGPSQCLACASREFELNGAK